MMVVVWGFGGWGQWLRFKPNEAGRERWVWRVRRRVRRRVRMRVKRVKRILQWRVWRAVMVGLVGGWVYWCFYVINA